MDIESSICALLFARDERKIQMNKMLTEKSRKKK
jgi:hypothetical protein